MRPIDHQLFSLEWRTPGPWSRLTSLCQRMDWGWISIPGGTSSQ